MAKKLRRWVLYLFIGFLAFLGLALIAGTYFLEQYLQNEITVGEGRLRLTRPSIEGISSLHTDSLHFEDSSIVVRSGPIDVDIRLFSGFLRFQPTVVVVLDTVYLQLLEGEKDTTDNPLPDSIAFPQFKIPVEARINAGKIVVANDSGELVVADQLRLHNPKAQRVELSIETLRSPLVEGLEPALELKANWSSPDSVEANLRLAFGDDAVELQANHSKENLLLGRDSIFVKAAAMDRYFRAAGIDSGMPEINQVKFALGLRRADTHHLTLNLGAKIRQLPSGIPVRLSPQTLSLEADYHADTGSFSLTSKGKGREDITFRGGFRTGSWRDLDSAAQAFTQTKVRMSGRVRGIPIKLGEEWTELGMQLHHLVYSPEALKARFTTADSSSVEADLVQLESGGWKGDFTADLRSEERWLRLFVDTSVTFSTLHAVGRLEGTLANIHTTATRVRAYGAVADSLFARHSVDSASYRLLEGRLYNGPDPWEVEGFVNYKGQGEFLEFRARHDDWGSVTFGMPAQGTMQGSMENLHPLQLPYTILDTLPVEGAVVTGDFYWNLDADTGSVDLSAKAAYKEAPLEADVEGAWNPDSLWVRQADLRLENSRLAASALASKAGMEITELGQLKMDDLNTLTLDTKDFNLHRVLSLFMEQPQVEKGFLEGKVSYSPASGFEGSLETRELVLSPTKELFEIEEFRVEGNGDSLFFNIITSAEDEPFFNDSLHLAVTGILTDTQQVSMRLAVGEELHFNFQGRVAGFENLEGMLRGKGLVNLPGAAGRLQELELNAGVYLPFDSAVANMKLRDAEFKGRYLVEGIAPQQFLLRPQMDSGVLNVPELRVWSEGKKPLTGTIRADLIGTGEIKADIQGPSFAVQWKKDHRIDLDGIRVRLQKDNSALHLEASMRRARLTYKPVPLAVEATLKNVELTYHQPEVDSTRAASDAESLASLKAGATLDSSLVAYRLKSMDALKSLFGRGAGGDPATPEGGGGGTRPMEVDISIQTRGTENRIDTDIIQLAYNANMHVRGTYPYALYDGRVTAISGTLGTLSQGYSINTLEAKWLRAPLDEGEVDAEAQKQLATTCGPDVRDSCLVFVRLGGEVDNLQFTYDTNCGGEFGAGADVTALIFSVQRGCYSPELATGAGRTYGAQALDLLTPALSDNLSDFVGKYSNQWINRLEIQGLSALLADSVTQAVSVEVTSKEKFRLRLKIRSGYLPESDELSNPWNHRLALIWRPPFDEVIDDEQWLERLENRLRMEASVETNPDLQEKRVEETTKRLGLLYDYEFWDLF